MAPVTFWVAALGGLLSSDPARANVTFNLILDPGTPTSVADGFNLAANRWSSVLGDDIVINLEVGFQALPAGVIGQTTSQFVQHPYADVLSALTGQRTSPDDFSAVAQLPAGPGYSRLINHTADNPNGPNSAARYLHGLNTLSMTRANSKALGLLGSGTDSDAAIRFNSSVAFDFDPGNGTTSGQYDFATLASHEIGHVLGFNSIVDPLDNLAGAGLADDLPSMILDLFRFSTASRAAGPGITDCTADTRPKYFSVDGGATSAAGFATGVRYGTGYQAGHWAEFTWVGLMDPTVFPGMQRQISERDLRAFDVIGYTVVPEPATGTLLALGLLAGLAWKARPARKSHLSTRANAPVRTRGAA